MHTRPNLPPSFIHYTQKPLLVFMSETETIECCLPEATVAVAVSDTAVAPTSSKKIKPLVSATKHSRIMPTVVNITAPIRKGAVKITAPMKFCAIKNKPKKVAKLVKRKRISSGKVSESGKTKSPEKPSRKKQISGQANLPQPIQNYPYPVYGYNYPMPPLYSNLISNGYYPQQNYQIAPPTTQGLPTMVQPTPSNDPPRVPSPSLQNTVPIHQHQPVITTLNSPVITNLEPRMPNQPKIPTLDKPKRTTSLDTTFDHAIDDLPGLQKKTHQQQIL